MPLVDEQGRVAGRFNLVDALVAVLILVVIPVAYGAYLLFQSPPPKLLGIEPATQYQGPNLKIGINGINFRPFMRVSLDNAQGRTFLLASTKSAFVDLPDLGPGTYDVVLFDYKQEVSRLPKALTILPSANISVVEMEVAGSFKQMSDKEASQLKSGMGFPPTGGALAEIVSVGTPVPGRLRVRAGDTMLSVPTAQTDLPATLKLHCWLLPNVDGSVRCMMSGPTQPAVVAPDSVLTLKGPQSWLNFQIDEVHLGSAPATVQARVRLLVTPEILTEMKTGDVDTSPNARAQGHAATIVSIGAVRTASASESAVRAPLGGAGRVVEVTVRVPVEQAAAGWIYKDQPFKAGAPFTFETPRYVVHGEVGDVDLPPSPPKAPESK